MLQYAAVFFVIALIAAVFGFTGIAVGAAEIAKVLFFIFLALFVISLLVGMFRRSPSFPEPNASPRIRRRSTGRTGYLEAPRTASSGGLFLVELECAQMHRRVAHRAASKGSAPCS
jgi:uncharacterized membrane protein YtjA (UPF0391 family)